MPDLICYALHTMVPATPPSQMVLGLGNFDGVHIAHQALFQLVKELGDHAKPHAACGAFCFTQPSADYLMSSPPLHLCTLEQKLELFRSLGIEYAFVADFSKVMHLTPSEFVRKILIDRCHCVGAVCGFNYRFGKGGSGSAQTLKELLNAPVVIQDAVYDGSEPVSSTRIRKLLSEGYVEDAAKMLTRPYFFSAPVIHGKRLGRRLGAPTINQAFPTGMLIPKKGVYVTDCEVGGKVYRAITNIGVRPTVEQGADVNCESHLLDYEGDLYEKTVKVSFLKRIRGEMTFHSTEELREQIHRDIEFARAYF